MAPAVELGFRWLVALVIGFCASASSVGMIAHLPLDEMVAESSLVVLGEVESVNRICGPCPEPNQPTLFSATVRVEDTLKGIAQGTVRVYFSPGMEPSPTFSIGQRYILLLQPWKEGWITVQGYGGKLDIVNAAIPLIYASGEPKNQPVDAVIARIRHMGNR